MIYLSVKNILLSALYIYYYLVLPSRLNLHVQVLAGEELLVLDGLVLVEFPEDPHHLHAGRVHEMDLLAKVPESIPLPRILQGFYVDELYDVPVSGEEEGDDGVEDLLLEELGGDVLEGSVDVLQDPPNQDLVLVLESLSQHLLLYSPIVEQTLFLGNGAKPDHRSDKSDLLFILMGYLVKESIVELLEDVNVPDQHEHLVSHCMLVDLGGVLVGGDGV